MIEILERRCDAGALAERARGLVAAGGRLMALFATPSRELNALVASGPRVTRLRSSLEGDSYPALTPSIPAAHWYEREIHDLHRVVPEGHPRLEPLLHPDNGRAFEEGGGLEHRGHRRLEGEGVFLIPYGPVRSGVFEASQFLVQTSGEDVAYCAQRLFFKRRGAERRICEVPTELAVLVAERASGTSSVAHALSFCQAIETLAAVEAPPRAAAIRTVLAELERLHNHLEVLVRECEDCSLTVGQAQLAALKERLHRLCAELAGNRYLRGAVVPGGVRLDIDRAGRERIRSELESWRADLRSTLRLLLATDTFIDRLVTAGPLSIEDARDFACVGPTARGSGIAIDARSDLSYAAYPGLGVEPRIRVDGDAMARIEVRLEEIESSLEIADRIVAALEREPGPLSVEIPRFQRDGALGIAESARGEVLYHLEPESERSLGFCKLRAASFANFGIFNRLFEGQVLTDFAFIEHSLGLSPAGCDA